MKQRTMWISTVHIVIVYFCACVFSAETAATPLLGRIRKRSTLFRNNNYNRFYNDYNNGVSDVKLRHQSRFPKKVIGRVNNMHIGGYDKIGHAWKRTTTTTTTTTAKPKTDEIFENYFDDDYKDKEDDWGNDKGDNEYEDYEDDGVFSDMSGWQAEEPTLKPSTTPRQMSKLSEMKWQMFGTREKVEENRKKELNSNAGSETSATLARVHFMRVSSEGTCKKPLPRVISVQAEHPDLTKSYTPHCTVLHRCAEDTGCCVQHNMRCGPKSQEEVHLYFYAKTLGTLQSKIEKLIFWNHTECTCVEKNSKSANTIIDTTNNELQTRASQNLSKCSCPKSFSPKQKYESQCSCNCEESNPDCVNMKKGLEFFSLADRKCVMEKRCGIPICEFGAYIRPKGRCPRIEEKLGDFEHLNIN